MRRKARTYYHYAGDEIGSVIHVLDSEKVVNEYRYDAFGNTIYEQEEVANRFRYAGQQYDGVTGQYYLRARYYNPVIGRFTQEDVYYGDGLNLYAYCQNNPVGYYDPSGYVCQKKFQRYQDLRKKHPEWGAKQTYDAMKYQDLRKNNPGMTAAEAYKQITGKDSLKQNTTNRVPKPGDIDFVGPIKDGSWKLVPEGDGAHLVERSNVKKRPALSMYDQSNTPRYYPAGTPESAGQAHLRLHRATKNEGIKLRGGNPSLSDSQLLNKYVSAYSSTDLNGIVGDLRTPDSSTIIVTNVSPSNAMNALLEWGSNQERK